MIDEHTLISNSGIQYIAFRISINLQDKFKTYYHEWYDTETGEWKLDPVYDLENSDSHYFYNKKQLYKAGYLSNAITEIDIKELQNEGILPLKIDDENFENTKGDIFGLTFSDKNNKLSCFENVWLPLPYFQKRTEKRFDFGPFNWSRVKLIPRSEEKGIRKYDVVIAFDTRTKYQEDEYKECPVFNDSFKTELDFALCSNEFLLMDFCTSGEKWSYIDEYLFKLVNPGIQNVSQIRGSNTRRTAYLASYVFLINYFVKKEFFPKVKLYRDRAVEIKDIDMVVDIGNSRTTALLIEDSSNFNQVRHLELVDYTDLIKENNLELDINRHSEPFDMRVVFRKVQIGDFGIKNSKQFVYPSLVRLGTEAKTLIHKSSEYDINEDSLSTYSSPKRYLWDSIPTKEEWKFLVLKDEKDHHILNLQGITNQLTNEGKIDPSGCGGNSFHYSRKSLMTFAFLEMLVQANCQINSEKYRSGKTGFGNASIPRRIRRVIITCPTAMSEVERKALIDCANDAVKLHENFCSDEQVISTRTIEVIPSNKKDENGSSWYYDEATCAQLVYMYGEVGHKYKGCCGEFFKLYGKSEDDDNQPTITVGSLDIGAGTSDLMISKYTYHKDDVTVISPDPQFYDSYYFAGDDMLYALINQLIFLDEDSSFRKELKDLSLFQYRQQLKNFFGEDYNGQTLLDRNVRRDFNLQYSVPLMTHFLELSKEGSDNSVVSYEDVFSACPPNQFLIDEFKRRLGIDITTIKWNFDKNKVNSIIARTFEPLLKKIATIIYSYACDVVLLSGRPASLPAVRDLFLKYYSISPNRLIVLNNYYVGNWFPFSNNTGYVSDSKTIVAMGGIIAHYASDLSNLNKFIIDVEKLKENLKSTVNYIEYAKESLPISYLITPDKLRGELTISALPEILNVKQIGMESYPSRALYRIDFNRQKMGEKFRKKTILSNEPYPTDSIVNMHVKDMVDSLKKRMPFKVVIERDIDDKEKLDILSILDKDGNEVVDSNLDIIIQSLGAADKYWLDSGSFEF